MASLTIASILVGLALLVVVVLFVARPLLRPAPVESQPLTPRGELLEQKAAILDEIRALDFDFETAKIPEDVYEQQRAFLMEQAAITLQALDDLPQVPADDDVVAQINAAIAALRTRPAPAAPPVARDGRGGYCTQCGQPLDAGDRFCAGCGRPVSLPQPVA